MDGHAMGEEFATDGKPRISMRVVGTAPLHEVELKRGTETIFRHPFAEPRNAADKLIKVEWSGVRVKSRPKKVDWEGGLRLDKGRILAYEEFAFDYPTQGIRRVSDSELEWTSTTGGDPDGVILKLDAPEDAEMTFRTKPIAFSFRLRDVGYEPMVFDASGVNQRVRVSAISGGELPRSLNFSYVDEDPIGGVSPYWMRVVQNDGGMAWSSPVYVDYRG